MGVLHFFNNANDESSKFQIKNNECSHFSALQYLKNGCFCCLYSRSLQTKEIKRVVNAVSPIHLIQISDMEDIPDSKNTWTIQEEEQVFALHSLYGNKWSVIAARIPGRTENSVKNKFYSTLRRGLRKINKFISKVRRKTHKEDLSNNKIIPPDFLTKLSAIADGNFSNRYEAKPKAVQASQDIKLRLIHLAQQSYEYDSNSPETFQLQQGLLRSILQFKKHCKKRKGKKKVKLQGNTTRRQKPQEESSSGQSELCSLSNLSASKNQDEDPENGGQLRYARTQVKIQQQLVGQNPFRFQGLQRGFNPQQLEQGLRPSGNIENQIKKSPSPQQHVQNMFGQYPITTSTLMPMNYSFMHMVGPSPSFGTYQSFQQGFIPTLPSLDANGTSFQWEMMTNQTLDHRFCFLEQIPMLCPKQSTSLAESVQVRTLQDSGLASRREPGRSLGTSQAYMTGDQDNNNKSRLARSDSISRIPLKRTQKQYECKEQEQDNRPLITKQ